MRDGLVSKRSDWLGTIDWSKSKWKFNLSNAGERSVGVIKVEVAEIGDRFGVLLVVDEREENGCVGEKTGEFKSRKRNICSTC